LVALGFATIAVLYALAGSLWLGSSVALTSPRLNDPVENGATVAGLTASVGRLPQSDFFNCRLQAKARFESRKVLNVRGRFGNR